jgi:hypothetical protein
MQNDFLYLELIRLNFSRLRYLSLWLLGFSIYLLIADFSFSFSWNELTGDTYKILDFSLFAVAFSFSLYFWLYRKEKLPAQGCIVKGFYWIGYFLVHIGRFLRCELNSLLDLFDILDLFTVFCIHGKNAYFFLCMGFFFCFSFVDGYQRFEYRKPFGVFFYSISGIDSDKYFID